MSGIPWEALVAVVLAVAVPVWGVLEIRWLGRRLEAGAAAARRRTYLGTMLVEWALALLVVGLWIGAGREPAALGLGLAGGKGFGVGIVLTALAAAFVILQTHQGVRSPESLAAVREQLGRMELLLPHTLREERLFRVVSVTAGICEEILYRGFLYGWLAELFGAVPAALASAVVFGLGHAYQGAGGIAKTSIVGLALTGLYVLTGSLWAPMLVHALFDLNGGMLARAALLDAAEDRA